ncbi:MAG: xanthine dehydrogenase accessory protein XdhC [Halobacteriovoraceae bacterium]|nr:xanthine dehydrogenase accessory protein XdhC [Halobacteriovoraceae bacterium]
MFQRAIDLLNKNQSFVMVTLISVDGSAPQDPGAKCIVTNDGLDLGTIGGGKVEARAIEFAQMMLSKETLKSPYLVKWNLQKDIGMTCGGVVQLLFESFPGRSWPVAIFGAGHVSQALTKFLSKLNCQITVIDDRLEWLRKLDNVQIIHSANVKEIISNFNQRTYFLCMTKGHSSDVSFLREIYLQFPNAPYVGAIGSLSKKNTISKELKSLGVSDEFINRLHIPLGLPIGDNSPEEISISIIAQLLQVRDLLSKQNRQ